MRGDFWSPEESLRDLRVERRKGYFVRSENRIVFVAGRKNKLLYFGNGARQA